MVMAVEIRPDRGVRIEVLPAIYVAQHCSMTFNNEDRLPLQPILHLRKRMPDISPVEFSQTVHGQRAAGKAFGVLRAPFRAVCSALATLAMSSDVCAAVTVSRSRAWPRATVG